MSGYRWASRSEAQANGWFSRRHQTSEAFVNAQSRRLAEQEARLLASKARDVEAKSRSPKEQLGRLDAMFGKAVGAVRERARLLARIEKDTPKSKPAKG